MREWAHVSYKRNSVFVFPTPTRCSFLQKKLSGKCQGYGYIFSDEILLDISYELCPVPFVAKIA